MTIGNPNRFHSASPRIAAALILPTKLKWQVLLLFPSKYYDRTDRPTLRRAEAYFLMRNKRNTVQYIKNRLSMYVSDDIRGSPYRRHSHRHGMAVVLVHPRVQTLRSASSRPLGATHRRGTPMAGSRESAPYSNRLRDALRVRVLCAARRRPGNRCLGSRRRPNGSLAP